ncbi:MAG TPA: CBS domain-containing protein [Candidatus Nitrosopolaris rasttigaisensis]|nr:CBS domain-containing protein [Candidatus Nitrosopolaris rasttigaisensis]
MRKKLESIEETTNIQEAAKKMKDKNVSSLVVVDMRGKPMGLVTERDLVRKVCINDVRSSTVTSKEIMSFPLITIEASSSPSAAADMMLKNNVRHLLVVDEGSLNKPIGIITPLDFTRYQEYTAEEDKEAIEKVLENYMSSPEADAFTGV